MVRLFKQLSKAVLSVILLAPALVCAGSAELDEAVKQYYAGNPEQALGLLEPVAMDGNVEAQYLMGNILYSLSNTEEYKNLGDPIKWYQMAADQGVADASYAIAVIYHNNWNESRDRIQAALAITHFQNASDAGYRKAAAPLNKLKEKTGMSVKTAAKLASQSTREKMVKVEAVEKIEDQKNEAEMIKQAEKQVEVIAKVEPKGQKEPEEKVETPVVEPKVEIEVSIVEPEKIEPVEPESASETESVVPGDQSSITSEAIADLVDNSNIGIVTLAELARECGNYTQIGYSYYADSIKGSTFKGVATITKSPSSTAQMSLVNDKHGIVVVISLNQVPKQISKKLRIGDEMEVSATIEHSQIIGSSCAIDLSYQQADS